MNIPLTPVRFLRYAETQFPKKTAVVCNDLRMTYAEFGDRVACLAGALRAAGVKRGDRVAFLTMNCHRLLEAYFGVLDAGAVLLPLNYRLSPTELAYVLNDSGASVLFIANEFVDLVDSFRSELKTVRAFHLLDVPPQKSWLDPRTYDQLLAEATPHRVELTDFDENSVAELFYTSGTSSNPKGVMLTHRNIYLHAIQVSLHHITKFEDTVLHTIPLFHANGWGTAHNITFAGGTHIMIPRFVPEEVLRLLQKERVTILLLVPTTGLTLLHHPDLKKYDVSSLTRITIGGAPSWPSLIRDLEQSLGCKAFSGYGLTECSPSLSTAELKPDMKVELAERYELQSSAGYALPGVELRVVDDEDNEVPHDNQTMGEIVARGDNIMAGYWNQPEATAEAMRGGWFHTGDMGVIAANGFITILDRKKDLIISGGENISSLEVEKALLAHSGVMEAAAIAVRDERWGEVPKGVVVRKPGSSVTEEELINFCRTQLAHYKCPRSIEFVEALPKNATGKILRKELRKQFWGGEALRAHS